MFRLTDGLARIIFHKNLALQLGFELTPALLYLFEGL